MINKTETDLYYYNNPLVIQSDILTDLEARLNGEGYVADSNNTFGFLLESFSTIVANCIQGVELKLNALYPKRSQTMEDLYNHISDFDYVSFQAAPANMTISITLVKNFAINGAVDYNTHYNLLVIPKNTKFLVGNIPFSLYHDIMIRVNKNTNNILLGYNTEEENPLFTIKNYDILYTEFTYSGVDYLTFEIPIYQFEKTITEETIDTSIGFIKRYSFENKFYALRVFDTINNTELSYSFSNIVYDPLNPTCIINVYHDKQEIEVSIPQVYFTNNQISSKLKIELYTTLGVVDINIDTSNTELISGAFNIEEADPLVDYVNAFTTLSTILLSSVSSKIVGGSDCSDFDTIKNNIVYNLYANRVPISNLDIENYFMKDGFRVINQVDNLTERVYYALKYICDDTSEKLPIVNSKISINTFGLDIYQNHIKTFGDEVIVIMPNTIFSFDKLSERSSPLTDAEIESLTNKTTEAFIDEVNTNTYTRNIYHTLVLNSRSNPEALSFDLMTCKINDIVFEKENVYIPYQTSVIDAKIVHRDKGCNSYKLTIGIHKSKELQDVLEEDFLVYLTCEAKNTSLIGKKFEYESQSDDLYIYSLILESDYYLTEETISLINMDYSAGYIGRHGMSFNTNSSISFFVKESYVPGIDQDNEIFNTTLIGTYHGVDYIAISKQSLNINFGQNLQDLVQNTLSASYNPQQYEIYDANVYDTYTKDIYERNLDGTLRYTIDTHTNSILLYKLHENGDFKTYQEIPIEKLKFLFNTFGEYDQTILVQFDDDRVIKFRKGDIKFDDYGNPVLIGDRILSLTVESFQLDLKYYSLESFNIDYIYELLQTYYSVIVEKKDNLYGNTLCYYKPISTLGYGVFGNTLNNSITLDLDISVGFKIYIHSYLINDEGFIATLKRDIIKIIKDELDNNVFSLNVIANIIQDRFSDYIQNVDIKGINDDIYLQVLIKTTNEHNINIKKLLYIDDNNEVNIQDDIDIEFVEVA